MSLEIRLLGPLEAVTEDGPMDLGGPRRRSVLAILALAANSVVSIDRLADELYGYEPPATAVAQVQRQVSDLRKTLGVAIETRPPGYLLRVERGELDLERFEQLSADGRAALERGEPAEAAARLREALALWRGGALEDLNAEPFAAAAVARLNDLRLATLERRIEAELALGAHNELIPDLAALVREHPAHEGFAAQFMLALYRCGRQQDALAIYRELRARLVHDYGIEPTPSLRALEVAMLHQDKELDAPATGTALQPSAAVLVCSRSEPRVESLTALAAPLARTPGRELLLVRLLDEPGALGAGAAGVARLRVAAGVAARGAAFVSDDVARDVRRLIDDNAVDLVLLDAPEISKAPPPAELVALLERSPADVALVAGGGVGGNGRVLVAFAGGEHDWAALELGAWLASASGCELALAGPSADGAAEATRMLAAASLAVQRSLGIDAVPLLVRGDQLVAAADGARAVVCGLPPGWRRRGVGTTRGALVRDAQAPVLVVHSGPRPGGLAPADSLTRFTWSIA